MTTATAPAGREARLIRVRGRLHFPRHHVDPRSFDPTQGVKIGSDPYDDPTQGVKIGSDPFDDPTRAG